MESRRKRSHSVSFNFTGMDSRQKRRRAEEGEKYLDFFAESSSSSDDETGNLVPSSNSIMSSADSLSCDETLPVDIEPGPFSLDHQILQDQNEWFLSEEDPLSTDNDYSSSDSGGEEATQSTPDTIVPLKEQLAAWQLKNSVPHSHCDELLKILQTYHPELPGCTRTLVQTPLKVNVVKVDPGVYYHFGIGEGLINLFKWHHIDNIPSTIKILVGVDGVKLTNSSSSQFWPIVASVPSIKKSKPFEIGVYHGLAKPDSANNFLETFVDEAVKLFESGLIIEKVCVKVIIYGLICDAPARAMITCTKSHSSSLHGCSKCDGNFIEIGNLRTNQSFRQKNCVNHHHGSSVLERISYLDLVSDIPLDPMHLLDLGVMRKILEFLTGSKKGRNIPHVTLNPATIRKIDSILVSLKPSISRIDFARKPQPLKELPRWKATELRQFLHYLGVIVFRLYLSNEYYEHFLTLHVAIKLLSKKPWCFDDNKYAHDLLSHFVTKSPTLYTDSFVSYNVHSLLHLSKDVEHFGTLDKFSAYQYENHYGHMKRLLRKNDKPLKQLVKRITERNKNHHILDSKSSSYSSLRNNVKFSSRHVNGPIVARCSGKQFKTAECKKWKLRVDSPDNCVYLKDLSVIVILNFVSLPNNNVIIGKKFENRVDVYKTPVPSSVIHEFEVSSLSEIQAWDMNDIKCKAVKFPASFPCDDSYIVFPLLKDM